MSKLGCWHRIRDNGGTLWLKWGPNQTLYRCGYSHFRRCLCGPQRQQCQGWDQRVASVMDARSAKQSFVSHGCRFFVTRTYSETARRYLLSVDLHGKMVYGEMLKVVGIGAYRPRKSSFLIMQNNNRFGSGPCTVLSMDRLLLPEPNVNVYSSTFVTSYRALAFLTLVCVQWVYWD